MNRRVTLYTHSLLGGNYVFALLSMPSDKPQEETRINSEMLLINSVFRTLRFSLSSCSLLFPALPYSIPASPAGKDLTISTMNNGLRNVSVGRPLLLLLLLLLRPKVFSLRASNDSPFPPSF